MPGGDQRGTPAAVGRDRLHPYHLSHDNDLGSRWRIRPASTQVVPPLQNQRRPFLSTKRSPRDPVAGCVIAARWREPELRLLPAEDRTASVGARSRYTDAGCAVSAHTACGRALAEKPGAAGAGAEYPGVIHAGGENRVGRLGLRPERIAGRTIRMHAVARIAVGAETDALAAGSMHSLAVGTGRGYRGALAVAQGLEHRVAGGRVGEPCRGGDTVDVAGQHGLVVGADR